MSNSFKVLIVLARPPVAGPLEAGGELLEAEDVVIYLLLFLCYLHLIPLNCQVEEGSMRSNSLASSGSAGKMRAKRNFW